MDDDEAYLVKIAPKTIRVLERASRNKLKDPHISFSTSTSKAIPSPLPNSPAQRPTTMIPGRALILILILTLTSPIIEAFTTLFGVSRPSSLLLASSVDDTAVDRCISLRPAAIERLKELRSASRSSDGDAKVLRMGVRSGGCSGLSYSMDFVPLSSTTDDDVLDDYPEVDGTFQCAVDAKSLLYLYGMELDYSTELIGGGFQFFNPNAEESCGCGKSFGV